MSIGRLAALIFCVGIGLIVLSSKAASQESGEKQAAICTDPQLLKSHALVSAWRKELNLSIAKQWKSATPVDAFKNFQCNEFPFVLLEINKSGKFVNATFLQRASENLPNHLQLDEAAMAAVRSAKYPSFPTAQRGDTIRLKVDFYTISTSARLLIIPAPQRLRNP